MTSTELSLFRDLIKETFKTAIREELDKFEKKFEERIEGKILESVKKASGKDLKEIKLLVAKSITEGRKQGYPDQEQRTLTDETKSILQERFNRMQGYSSAVNAPMATAKVQQIQQEVVKNVADNKIASVLAETVQQEFDTDKYGFDETSLVEDAMPQQPVQNYGPIEEEYVPRNFNMPSFPR